MYYLGVMSVSLYAPALQSLMFPVEQAHNRGPAAVLSVFFSLGCMELGQVSWLTFRRIENTKPDPTTGLLRFQILSRSRKCSDRSRVVRIHTQAPGGEWASL